MIKLLASLRLHLFFIILIQILYTLVSLFRPEQLESYWLFLYTGVCIFIYMAAGWIVMHETGKRLYAALAGLIVFAVGYLTQLLGLFVVAPLAHHLTIQAGLPTFLKFIRYGLYYALIALALAVIGAHICSRYQRHKLTSKE